MKTHPSRRPAGFTLVELLVVIAIIAVLAGAGFAAGNAAIQKAKKATTLSTCTAIETAVNNFYSDYGALPKDAMTADTNLNTKDDKPFLRTLLGLEGTAPTALNTRAVKYLSVKEGKAKGSGGTNGLIYTTGGTSDIVGLFDSWGGPFQVVLDGDWDEKIVVTTAAGQKTLNGRRVAVWSNGADNTGTSSTAGKATDDVTTW
jgi:prepilin-type N-terminal cleavage/methylation domain-containing protein